MALKLPRTIRLDPSDTLVFERAAEPGEWAVTGSFLFCNVDSAGLTGKERAAFRTGFLGVGSFGFSTLVVVTDTTEAERKAAVEALAQNLETRLGAPSRDAAWTAASEEVDFAASLCQHEAGTLLALNRSFEAGEIREQFRALHLRDRDPSAADRLHSQARAFEFVEVEDDRGDSVDLVGLVGAPQP
jgi:hypothetical protein